MMIKPKGGYVQLRGTKAHLLVTKPDGTSWGLMPCPVWGGVPLSSYDEAHHKETCDIDERHVCKHCLTNADAWEYVNESAQTVDKIKAECREKTSFEIELELEKTAHISTIGDLSGSCRRIEELLKGIATLKKDLASSRACSENHYDTIQQLRKSMDALKDHNDRLLKTNDELREEKKELDRERLHLRKVRETLEMTIVELGEDIAELTRHHSDACNQLVTITAERNTLREIIGDHTPENVKAILSVFDLEKLDGHTLEYRLPKHGESCRCFNGWKLNEIEMEPAPDYKYLIRTPIVEYIEGNDITDELVQKHGRFGCEVRDADSHKWYTGRELVCVNRGVPAAFHTMHSGIHEVWDLCRIDKRELTK